MPAVAAAHLFAVGASDCGLLVSEAAGLLLDWGFTELDLDKVWIEAPEFNLAQFHSIEEVAEIEGRLRDFDHWQGRFWDLFILSIKKQNWETNRVSQIVRSRSEPLDADRRTQPSELEAELSLLFAETWPLDSLGRVETLTILEEASGRPIDADLLDCVNGLEPADAATALVEAVPS